MHSTSGSNKLTSIATTVGLAGVVGTATYFAMKALKSRKQTSHYTDEELIAAAKDLLKDSFYPLQDLSFDAKMIYKRYPNIAQQG